MKLFTFLPSDPVDGDLARQVGDAIIASGIPTHGNDINAVTRFLYWGGHPNSIDDLREYTAGLSRVSRSHFLGVWTEIARFAGAAMAAPPPAPRGRPTGGALPKPSWIHPDVVAILPELLVFVPPRPLSRTAWCDLVTVDNMGMVAVIPRRGGGTCVRAEGYRIPASYAGRLLGTLARVRFPDAVSPEEAIYRLRADPVLSRLPLIGMTPGSRFPVAMPDLERYNTMSGDDIIRMTRVTVSPSVAASQAASPTFTPGGATRFGGVPLPSSSWVSADVPASIPQVFHAAQPPPPQTPQQVPRAPTSAPSPTAAPPPRWDDTDRDW